MRKRILNKDIINQKRREKYLLDKKNKRINNEKKM